MTDQYLSTADALAKAQCAEQIAKSVSLHRLEVVREALVAGQLSGGLSADACGALQESIARSCKVIESDGECGV